MNRKAQESRNDLLVWYAASFLIVIAVVGGLYGLGIIGNGQKHGSLIKDSEITAAVIAVPGAEPIVEEPPETTNTTDDNISSVIEENQSI